MAQAKISGKGSLESEESRSWVAIILSQSAGQSFLKEVSLFWGKLSV